MALIHYEERETVMTEPKASVQASWLYSDMVTQKRGKNGTDLTKPQALKCCVMR